MIPDSSFHERKRRKHMDISSIMEAVTRSERYRSPNAHERACGMWVDRIGWRREGLPSQPPAMRILGLYAIVAVEEGTGVLLRSGRPATEVAAGDTLIVWPDEPAAYHATGGGWCQRWVVWGGPAARGFERLCDLPSLGHVVRGAAQAVQHAYTQLRDALADESLAGAIGREAQIRTMVAQVLAESQRAGLSNTRCDAVDRVAARIREHRGSAPSLPELARLAGMSETHLRRLFAARMGMPPHAYIVVQRIARAKTLLADGLRAREVAEACGFRDEFYFMRVFKRVTGCTPGEWRNGPVPAGCPSAPPLLTQRGRRR